MSVKKYKNPHKKRFNPGKLEAQENLTRKFYNSLLLKQAMKIVNSNPLESKKLFEEYLELYPNDYYAYTVYAGILVTLKEFDLASTIIDFTETNVKSNKKLTSDLELKKSIEKNILFVKIRIMSFRGQYRKLLDYINEHSEIREKFHLDELILLCKKRLGICFEKRDDYNYLGRQVIDYKRQDMMNRINYHTADYNSNVLDEPHENIFSADFPIEKVIDEIERKYIPSEEYSICPGVLADCYYFRYDFCGKENQHTTNFIKVSCFHNTGNIISACPVIEGDNLPYRDLNYLREDNKSNNPKQLSRTEKFLRRYSKKI